MHTLLIHVPFKPTSQQRHRHTRGGRTYDPSSESKKAFLNLCLRTRTPPSWLNAPIRCSLRFQFRRPKSHRTSKGMLRKGIPVLHIYKPDTDNLAKFVLDALNGTYYKDDSQVHALHAVKRYGDEDSVRVQLDYT